MTVIIPSGVWRICMNSGPLALMHGYPLCLDIAYANQRDMN
jgi:hypothetical protein